MRGWFDGKADGVLASPLSEELCFLPVEDAISLYPMGKGLFIDIRDGL
tara:strand:+ start:530 stop:673 length:144 start_codon:yes stop_codon:yes gene_type:complete